MSAWSKTHPTEPGWYQVRQSPGFYTVAFLHSDGKWSWSGDSKPAKKKVSDEMIDRRCEFARIHSPEAIEQAKAALREIAGDDGDEPLEAGHAYRLARAALAALEGKP